MHCVYIKNGEKEAVFGGVQSEGGALCDSRRRDAGGAGDSLQDPSEHMNTKWKREALEGMKERFARGGKTTRSDHQAELKDLRAKIGELVVERDYLQRAFDR